jgi:predicted esterase
MYAAQRDAKAALRWVVANSGIYNIDTNFITVGGGSAGAITAITLGISNKEDFRDELTISEDPTLSSTNLDETYTVRSIINFWGSNIKLELVESIFGLNRYDTNDPELFTAHGNKDPNAFTPYSEAIELRDIYNSLGIYNHLETLLNAGHGAWNATVDGKSLSDMSFDFLVERQNLTIE